MSVTFGSLFAGIGGIDLGLERAGMACEWQVEIDDYATKVLKKHWPDVTRFRDVRECGVHNLEPVDLIAGGFPCQDISHAGKRAGIKGERSGLWSEFHRIICELRPRYALLENVSALLGRGMGVVLADLASCGYDAEWESLPASAFGAPHRRDRVFILARKTSVTYRERRSRFEVSPDRELPVLAPFRGEVAHAQSQQRSIATSRNWGQMFAGRSTQKLFADATGVWDVEPDVGRVADGVPKRVDRLKGLGNAVVPQIAEWIGQRIMELETG